MIPGGLNTSILSSMPKKLLLDQFPGAYSGLSTRKLMVSQTKWARVRIVPGNAEYDIGFSTVSDSLGNYFFDEADLLSKAAGGDAFVVTRYNPGSGPNATQATAALQPRIVNAGIIEKSGIYAGLNCLNNRFNSYASTTTVEYFNVTYNTTGTNLAIQIGAANSHNVEINDVRIIIFAGQTNVQGTTTGKNGKLIHSDSVFLGTNQSKVHINGSLLSTGHAGADQVNGIQVGKIAGYSFEHISYTSEQTANRLAITANQMSAFGITP